MHSIAAEALSLAMYGEGRLDYCLLADNSLTPDGSYRGATLTRIPEAPLPAESLVAQRVRVPVGILDHTTETKCWQTA